MHQHIGSGLGVAPFGTNRGRGIATQFDLAFEHRFHALGIDYQQDKIGRLSAKLKTETDPFQRIHRWRSPGAGKIRAAPARHGAAAETGPNANRAFLDRRQNNHALCAIQDWLGKIIGYVQDLEQNFTGMFEPLLFFFLGQSQ